LLLAPAAWAVVRGLRHDPECGAVLVCLAGIALVAFPLHNAATAALLAFCAGHVVRVSAELRRASRLAREPGAGGGAPDHVVGRPAEGAAGRGGAADQPAQPGPGGLPGAPGAGAASGGAAADPAGAGA